MARDTFQLKGNAAAIYEEQKVPSIFGPLAHATLAAVSVLPSDAVLDAACGTGIVARTLRDRLGPMARIIGVDINEGMIETARTLTRDRPDEFEWHVADIANLPFANASFSVVICQQGIQFFPNEPEALSEFRRVLTNNGQLILSVWAGASDFFKALAAAYERHVDAQIARQSLAPFTYRGAERLPELLEQAGFRDFDVQSISIDRLISNPKQSIPKEILGSPVGSEVAERGDTIMQHIVEEVISSCSGYQRGADLVIPQHAHLITARAH